MLRRLGFAAVILGGALAWVGFEEFRLSGGVKAEPRALSCAELVAEGPGDNAHVTLSDFVLCDFLQYVYSEKKGRWQSVWVPAVPVGGAYDTKMRELAGEDGSLPDVIPSPTGDCILVKMTDARDADDVRNVARQDVIRGVVVNEIESLSGTTRKLLAKGYPGIDFARCWIFEVGRGAPTRTKALGMMGGGVGIAGLFLFLMFRPRKREPRPPPPSASE